jgi:glycosyltransferase involved in cell wall biosynthesis
MRILLVSEDIPYPVMGGLAKHVLTLAKALVKTGHQVDILGGDQHPIEAAGEEGMFGGLFYGELKWHLAGWKERKIGAFLPMKRPWIAEKMAKCIISYASNYDVVHYHGHYPNIGKYIPQNINFVQTRHDQGSDCLTHSRLRNNGDVCTLLDSSDCAECICAQPNVIQRTISSLAVHKYRQNVAESFLKHKTIFVSEMLRNNFSRGAGNADWGGVLHHFINLNKIREVANIYKDAIYKNDTQIKLFFAGTLYPHKGIIALLEELISRIPSEMVLRIAGSSPLEQLLRERFECNQVVFLGWCNYETVLKEIAESDVMVVPSIWEEPFGSTTLEALLLGKPVFALNRGATPEQKIYERYANQLRLFENMELLVAGLINYQPRSNICNELDERGGVDWAIQKLLEIYSA